MKKALPPIIETFRESAGPMATDSSFGMNGRFHIPCEVTQTILLVIASDGWGWEHVSVSTEERTPTWEEMCFIKDIFWLEDETVVQYHPPKYDYVNCHKYCLHLWKSTRRKMPRPPADLVGPKGDDES